MLCIIPTSTSEQNISAQPVFQVWFSLWPSIGQDKICTYCNEHLCTTFVYIRLQKNKFFASGYTKAPWTHHRHTEAQSTVVRRIYQVFNICQEAAGSASYNLFINRSDWFERAQPRNWRCSTCLSRVHRYFRTVVNYISIRHHSSPQRQINRVQNSMISHWSAKEALQGYRRCFLDAKVGKDGWVDAVSVQ